MKYQTLQVTTLLKDRNTAVDGREYAVIGVKEPTEAGLINTAKPRAKVIWSHQPMSGPESENELPNDYFEEVLKALHNNKKPMITGSIEHVETEPYYIPNKNGKFVDPETGETSNIATRKTYVVFPDENVDSLLRSDNLVRSDNLARKRFSEEEFMQRDKLNELSEELVEEDLSESAQIS